MNTVKNIWFVPLERTFDVDAFSYKIFCFFSNDCHSMTMFKLVEKGKFFYFHASWGNN